MLIHPRVGGVSRQNAGVYKKAAKRRFKPEFNGSFCRRKRKEKVKLNRQGVDKD
jgi:hypothetical protein